MGYSIKNYLFIVLFLTTNVSTGAPLIPALITGLSRAIAYTALLAAPTLEKLITSGMTLQYISAGCMHPDRNSTYFSTHEIDKEMQTKIKSRLQSSTWPKDQLGFCREKTIMHTSKEHDLAEVLYGLTDTGLEQTFKFPKYPFIHKETADEVIEATADEVIDVYCAYIERENNEPININQKSREEKLRSYDPYGGAYCEAFYHDPISYYNLCMRYKDRIFKNIPSLPALSALPLYCIDKKFIAKGCSTTLGALACSPARIIGATVIGLGLYAIQDIGMQKIRSHHEETKDAYLPDNRVSLFKNHLQSALQKHKKNTGKEHMYINNNRYKLPTFAHFASYNKLINNMQERNLERRIAQLQIRENKLLSIQNQTATNTTSEN